MKDHKVFIRSDQSNTYYPGNTPFHFKVYLGIPLILEGEWEIGLLDFYSPEKIPNVKKNSHELYMFCDVCTGVNVFHNQYSLLRQIFPTPQNNWKYIFPPIFLPVKKTEIREIDIHIFDGTGQEASILKRNLSCTLQFRLGEVGKVLFKRGTRKNTAYLNHLKNTESGSFLIPIDKHSSISHTKEDTVEVRLVIPSVQMADMSKETLKEEGV
ncbi:unnamed protein product [Mytilus coruscus]|uniref:Uncharacterized protein n=1 Tax=Mytilus coruscus TaxID=42192 RepID=A0A6J8B7T7_MYTCO|nr:unnamed protein product [Mytilus coruscus]